MNDLAIKNPIQKVEVNRVIDRYGRGPGEGLYNTKVNCRPDIDPNDWRFWGSPIHCEPTDGLRVESIKGAEVVHKYR